MAATRHVFSTTVISDPDCGFENIDCLINEHKVGGLFITSRERDAMQDVLRFHYVDNAPTPDIPCRLFEVGCFFVCEEAEMRRRPHFGNARSSFGLNLTKLRAMKKRFTEINPDEDPAMQFYREMLGCCEVRDENFILTECFRVTPCDEHPICKHIIDYAKQGYIEFTCCDRNECTEFCSFSTTARINDNDVEEYRVVVHMPAVAKNNEKQ